MEELLLQEQQSLSDVLEHTDSFDTRFHNNSPVVLKVHDLRVQLTSVFYYE